ncbi:MAG: cysteine desulfurase [Fimbriimonadaceae bacterium]|nr:cysteine desulfurase [Fimbriimonadaceae bacterium]
MRPEHYFDYAASTPLDPRVFEAMRPWLTDGFGNASSSHSWGRRAREAVEDARELVAELAGAEPEEIAFTSCATEANNWVVKAAETVWYSPFEHACVRESAIAAGGSLLELDGCRLKPPPTPGTVCVMTVCNETGAVIQAPDLPAGSKLHRDAVQSLGKLPLATEELDSATFSAHKMYGPQGIGALYARDGDFPEPLLHGGGQEPGGRSGTLNVAGIVGFGEACRIAGQEMEADRTKATECRNALMGSLAGFEGVGINDHPENSPFILSVTVFGIQSGTLVVDLDLQGYAVSGGSACSAESMAPSQVLLALGLASEEASATIRISFGRFSSVAASAELGKAILASASRLRG